jgi:hypothetical protein
MPGKTPKISPLQSRKQLLLAESELNRALLVGDLAALTADVRALAARAKSISLIASSTAALVAGVAAFRRKKSAPGDATPSWLQTILKGAGLVSTLWLAFRAKERVQEDKS